MRSPLLARVVRSEEAAKIFAPPRPVVAEDATPDLQVIPDAFRREHDRKLVVLVHDCVVFARGDDPVDSGELPYPLAVHVGDVGGGAVEIAVVVPVAIELRVNVVNAGKADGAADDVRIAGRKVGR